MANEGGSYLEKKRQFQYETIYHRSSISFSPCVVMKLSYSEIISGISFYCELTQKEAECWEDNGKHTSQVWRQEISTDLLPLDEHLKYDKNY